MAFKIPEMLFSTFQGPSSPVFPQKSAFHHLYINKGDCGIYTFISSLNIFHLANVFFQEEDKYCRASGKRIGNLDHWLHKP